MERGQRIVGRFEVRSPLGSRGAAAGVYLGLDHDSERDVVVKVLPRGHMAKLAIRYKAE